MYHRWEESFSEWHRNLSRRIVVGSSTACMVALHKEKSILHTANLGDSGFVVIRKNIIVHRSQEQQHYFNSPFQLAIHPTIKDSRLIADRCVLMRDKEKHIEIQHDLCLVFSFLLVRIWLQWHHLMLKKMILLLLPPMDYGIIFPMRQSLKRRKI